MGRPFRQPVSSDLGEDPKDALARYLRQAVGLSAAEQGELHRPLRRAAQHPYGGQSTDAPARQASQPTRGRASIGLRLYVLVRLLDDSGLRVNGGALDELARKFNPGPRLSGDPLSVYWQTVLSKFAESSSFRTPGSPLGARL